MDFYNQLLAQKLSGGGGGDKYAAFKARIDGSLTDVTVDMLDGITKINSYAFSYSRNLINVEIPSSVTSIEQYAFQYCDKMSSIIIPSSVTSIGSYAFVSCHSISSIIIPSSVTYIGSYAFYICDILSSVTVESSIPPTIGTGIFGNTRLEVIYVPAESVDTYKSASGWSYEANKIQAIPSGN